MEYLNDDLDVLDIIYNGFPRRIYDRANYYEEMDNLSFFQRFRLNKPTVMALLEQIEEELEYPYLDKNNSVTPMNQLLTALRFYATDGHLKTIGDFMGIHEATVSRIVEKVSEVIARLRPEYVKMPLNGHEVIAAQNNFFQIASFPRVIGCVDGTHIRILSPGGEDAEVFRNRKGYFSVNVQIVGDADLKINNIVARWPGSAHDNTIFVNSRLRARLENGEFANSILLGDSAYALKSYLLTPMADPRTRAEQLYNEAHIRTRNTVERLFGVLKRRFPVLAYGLRLKLSTSLTIIVATCVLHNIARTMNEEEPPVEADIDIHHLNYLIEMGMIIDQPDDNNLNPGGHIFRRGILNYFENLLV